MATQSWAFTIDHQNDAGFRAWGHDFSTRLAAIGLAQTADTGQIDWATVTRPATNTTAGYEIWRFDDTQQSDAPIYLKFEYGTNNASTRPRILVSIGTGSDGSGNLTGELVTQLNMGAAVGGATGSSVQSFFCHADGFLGLVWGRNGPQTNYNYGTFMLCRTCDGDGVPTAQGCMFMWQNLPTSFSTNGTTFAANGSINFDTSTAYYGVGGTTGDQPPVGMLPGHVGGSFADADGDLAAMPFFSANPQPFPVFGMCAVWATDVSPTGTFNATIVGATERTYINIGPGGFGAVAVAAKYDDGGANINNCMLWE